MSHFTRFEGGWIDISGDLQAAVDWYCTHMCMHVGCFDYYDLEGTRLTAVEAPQ